MDDADEKGLQYIEWSPDSLELLSFKYTVVFMFIAKCPFNKI